MHQFRFLELVHPCFRLRCFTNHNRTSLKAMLDMLRILRTNPWEYRIEFPRKKWLISNFSFDPMLSEIGNFVSEIKRNIREKEYVHALRWIWLSGTTVDARCTHWTLNKIIDNFIIWISSLRTYHLIYRPYI
jgi:hypothetical protein